MTAVVDWPADPAAYGLGGPALPSFGITEKVKAQVSEISSGIEIASRNLYTRRFHSDLRRYAWELRIRPSRTRERRRFLADPAEIAGKIADECGDSPDVIAESWEHPEIMPLYRALGTAPGAAIRIDDIPAEHVGDIAWMMAVELADVDDDGDTIRLLSDCDQAGRNYPGAPVADARCKGRQLRGRAVDDARQVWELIVAGTPPGYIPPEQRKRMRSPHGIRLSARMMAYQCNAIEKQRRNAECQCPGRDFGTPAWELRGHDDGCPCLRAWVSVDTARRAIKALTADGVIVRTRPAYLMREGHTAVGMPAAYAMPLDAAWKSFGIPGDAGWHGYAAAGSPRPRHRPSSPTRRRLEKAA
jgi:hypothetical protein